MIYAEITVSGPKQDLHSGSHGGRAPNPATAIARLLATLHNPDGSIAVDGFYDGVTMPDTHERELANDNPCNHQGYRQQIGVPPVAGEADFTPVERVGFRPSLDVNGITSGYAGKGPKTIIPATASAKISARLVPGQDPNECLAAIARHLTKHKPDGLTVTITEQGVAGGALRLDPESALVAQAGGVLKDVTGQDTAFLWEGASIPILATLADTAGAEPLLVGFGSQQDNAHAIDESFSLDQFRNGYLFAARFLQLRE